jgi:hypothetical protein
VHTDPRRWQPCWAGPPIPHAKLRNFEKLVQGRGARLKAGVCRDDCYRSVARAVIRKQLRQAGTPTKYRSGTCSATPEQSRRCATLGLFLSGISRTPPIVHAHTARSRAVTAKRRMDVQILHGGFHGMSSRPEVRLRQRARVCCVGCVHLRSARVRAAARTCECLRACVRGGLR